MPIDHEEVLKQRDKALKEEDYKNYLEEVFDYVVNGQGLVGEVTKETFANETEEEKKIIRWLLAIGEALLICKKDQVTFHGPDPGHWEFFTEFLSIKPDNSSGIIPGKHKEKLLHCLYLHDKTTNKEEKEKEND